MKTFVILIILFFISENIIAQSLTNLRRKVLVTSQGYNFIDTCSIVPKSEHIFFENGDRLADSLYKIDYIDSRIEFKIPKNEKVYISYRVFSFKMSKIFYRKSDSIILPDFPINKKKIQVFDETKEFLSKSKLNKNGNLIRGISFGNNQDLTVNSSMNLQITGNLNDDIELNAVISDENLILQPDGNTQQIQDFDKIFIQAKIKQTSVTLGDIVLTKPSGYFMNLQKKIKGIQLNTSIPVDEKKKYHVNTLIAGAISKGIYNRMKFSGIEGNQGPYRLTGTNNEMYIIVVAASEKVFIDGKELVRGQENDYVIDYNTAEIIFTPKQPITKDKRIVVEFEYSDKYYTRYIFHTANEIVQEKSKFRFNYYLEQDAKSQPLQQDLSNNQKRFLAQLGDSINHAFYKGYDSTSFQSDLPMYQLKDSLVNGKNYDSIFVYSVNKQKAFYRLNFNYTGNNRGNYKQSKSIANGRVFEWIAPINNIPQGDYEPVILLITPKKKQMLTFGWDSKILKSSFVAFEAGWSGYDVNTFSSIHKNNDNGYALKLNYKQILLPSDTLKKRLDFILNYQYQSKYFQAIERFRPVEFERDWNLNSYQTEEHYSSFSLNYTLEKYLNTQINSEFLKQQSDYFANKNSMTVLYKKKSFEFIFSGNVLNSKNNIHTTSFIKYNSVFSTHTKLCTIGFNTESELNKWKNNSTDRLVLNSSKYIQYGLFIQNPDTSKYQYFFKYQIRDDYKPDTNNFISSSNSFNYSAGLSIKNDFFSVKSNMNYRELFIIDSISQKQNFESSFSGNIDISSKIFNKSIVLNSYFELSTGMEPKKEYTYIEVTTGLGSYRWIDYNQNGVKELNEFELTDFADEAKYIRIQLPSNQYQKTYATVFSQSIAFQPKNILKDNNSFNKFISRFSNYTGFQFNQKRTDKQFLSIFKDDTSVLSKSMNFKNQLSFNKTSSVFGIDYIFQKNIYKTILINGLEEKKLILNSIIYRINFTPEILFQHSLSKSEKKFDSEFLKSRNYRVITLESLAEIFFQPYLSLNYKYSDKKNSLSIEKSTEHHAGIDLKYFFSGKGNILASFNYIYINFTGNENTPVAYALLEGFQSGKNFTWSVIYEQTIMQNLQMNISYNARKTENSRIIHIGGMQLKMIF